MKITEQLLLEHYVGILTDGWTSLSAFGKTMVWWSYRNNSLATIDRAEATEIHLEENRSGTLPLADNPTSRMLHIIAERHKDGQEMSGDELPDDEVPDNN